MAEEEALPNLRLQEVLVGFHLVQMVLQAVTQANLFRLREEQPHLGGLCWAAQLTASSLGHLEPARDAVEATVGVAVEVIGAVVSRTRRAEVAARVTLSVVHPWLALEQRLALVRAAFRFYTSSLNFPQIYQRKRRVSFQLFIHH